MNNQEFLASIECSPESLTRDGIRDCLDGAGVLWTYPQIPHALLTSGKHSNGFVNVGSLLKSHPGICRAFAMSLVALLDAGKIKEITHVVGADTSSTQLAKDVANLLDARHIKMIKMKEEERKWQAFYPDNGDLGEESVILHVEELITTSSSAIQVRKGIREKFSDFSINFVPLLLTVVDRSDPDEPVEVVEESRVISLLRIPIKNYEPDDCPYCRAGSKAISPKKGNNWLKLTRG